MLLRFRCKNFRSIRDEQEISLVAMNTRTDEHESSLLTTPLKEISALRCVAFYGSNASGKSNVLRAMRRFSGMVADSQRKWEPTGSIPVWDPFLLDEESRTGETLFAIDFVKDAVVYNYGFRFSQSAILEEWLKEETGKSKTLFQRKSEGGAINIKFPGKNLGSTAEENRLLELIKLQTRANSLFLSCAAQGNHEYLASIYKWIAERFKILSPTQSSFRSFTAKSCAEPNRKSQIRELLSAADTGIVDFEISEEEAPETVKKALSTVFNAIKEVSSGNLQVNESDLFSHDQITMLHRGVAGKTYPLSFEQESAGTKAFFEMLGPILDELEQGGMLLIDELESSLHPNLARQLVRMFNDPTINPKGAQLIFATHNVTFLDLDLMRRDQFWFSEKDSTGATSLNPLSDYKPRKDQNIAAAYLHGRFGGIPFVDEALFETAVSQSRDIKSSEARSK